MNARPPLPHTPLTAEHARQLEALVATLSAEEALWISGYLAGIARQAPASAQPRAAAPEAPLLILYGTETGHSEGLAERAEQRAHALGLPVRLVDLAEFRPPEIKDARFVMLITATHGDGDPPAAAIEFWEYLQSRKAPRLEQTRFAVLALGDSTYERFCQTGKDFDRRFEALGAARLHPRADCDVDFNAPATAWIENALAAFAQAMQAGGAAIGVAAGARLAGAALAAAPATLRPPFDAEHPFPAVLLEKIVLNGRGSDKETLHVELSLAGSGLAWEPGDSLGVMPQNDPALVGAVIAALGADADTPVPAAGGELPLAEALSRHYEITALTPKFIEAYAEATGADALRTLLGADDRPALNEYLRGRDIIDVLLAFPPRGITADAFVGMLRGLQPRLYSLASSQTAVGDEAHLTVAVVRYASHGRPRAGVASAHLADRCQLDDPVPVHIARNKHFRLPADPAAPIIMIGPGTGVAPFRAFLQEREATGAAGRNWLFFGERRFRTDFLYQVEWQRWLKDGRLMRMDVAFSRDQPEKIYVQHRLLERAREVYAWMQDGATIYVCGDAGKMAADVHAALVQVIAREGGQSPEAAEETLKRLQREKRYLRDVY